MTEILRTPLYWALCAALVIPILLVIFGKVRERKNPGCDSPNYLSIFSFSFYFMDSLTDLLFIIWLRSYISEEGYNYTTSWVSIVFWGCIAFSIIPRIASLIYLWKLRKDWEKFRNPKMAGIEKFHYYEATNNFMALYTQLVTCLTLLAGIYPTMTLITSNWCHLPFFSLHLMSVDWMRLTIAKFVSTIFLEV